MLSVAGSGGELSTPTDIAERNVNPPQGAELVEINGSNHAQVGNYGEQPGDGRSRVADPDVKDRIDEQLIEFIGRCRPRPPNGG